MANPVPLPISDPIAQAPRSDLPSGQQDTGALRITEPWIKYFTNLGNTSNNSPARVTFVPITGASASITTTNLNQGVLSAGLYSLSYYTRITTPASVSSSLTLTFGWVDSGVAQTFVGAAITGNTTTTYQQDTIVFYADGNTSITYAAAYVSVGGTSMVYSMRVVLSALAV